MYATGKPFFSKKCRIVVSKRSYFFKASIISNKPCQISNNIFVFICKMISEFLVVYFKSVLNATKN